ncbi:MAG: gliding motility-associated C-terminal domain-containing protein [Lunatimonas sp.]|uniref:T9SS type B sorting domain-containing protein n=1 Tax=Lunatimonas sp. TaxID=2060141 RepID=UPI00263B2E09|nr:gliding motility-associated C-terminal domain-containing protein [Lunatimonas sp.]MCC5938711.1 gliding motility-associated C-terminal domain-containing protein [Lunatimonas sp.]
MLIGLKMLDKPFEYQFREWGRSKVLNCFSTFLMYGLLVFYNSIDLQSQSLPRLEIFKVPSSCPGNGQITANLVGDDLSEVSNTTYLLYISPNFQDPIATSENGDFLGLSVGRYLVRATGEFQGNPFTIDELLVLEQEESENLVFDINAENICNGDDGVISVVVLSGIAESFELRGPINFPPQTNPVFSGLREGAYTLIVTDQCGDAVSQTFQVFRPQIEIETSRQQFKPLLPSCGTISVGHSLRTSAQSFEFPINLVYNIYRPNGTLFETISRELTADGFENGLFFTDLPFFHDEAYSYELQAVDNCGYASPVATFEIDNKIKISEDLRWGAGPCGNRRLSVKPINAVAPFQIFFDDYPEGFDPEVFNEKFPGPFEEENIFFGSPANPIPEGFYDIRILDACGNSSSITVNHIVRVTAPTSTVLRSCTPGLAGIELLNFDYQMESVTLISGPEEYGQSYPVDLSQHISQSDPRRFFLSEIPSGTYRFDVTTSCGPESYRATVNVIGTMVSDNVVEVEENCGSFNLLLNHTSNILSEQNLQFGLQKRDPVTGEWGHPTTGARYIEGQQLSNINSVLLSNGQTNFNLAYSGDLRVVKSARVYKNGAEIVSGQSSFTHCVEELKTFNFSSRSTLESVNFFSCGDDNYDVYLTTRGYEPITYSIISINGNQVNIPNGTSPLFNNLEAGRYRFRMVDRCGNTSTYSLTLFGDNLPVITPSNLCEGEVGELQVPFFDQVSYEWFRADNPEVIIGTENNLQFAPFSIDTHAGVYNVRLSHPDTGSCINEVLEFTIDPNQLNGQAGTGKEETVCMGETINLFEYLNGPFGNYGNWHDLTGSGQLAGNLWNTDGLSPGVYEFRYEIFGLCSGDDETLVKLTLLPPVETPVGETIQEFCQAEALTLEILDVSGDNIQWHSTPAGNQPLDSTTLLEHQKTYYAEQIIDGCPSTERLPVTVLIYPPISNVGIDGGNQEVFQLEQIAPLTGQLPQGGKSPYVYRWEVSQDGENWIEIPDAVSASYVPEPLLQTSYFRRITSDLVCGDHISNEILIEVLVAPIIANDDEFGPLKGFQENTLNLSENDRFMDRSILPGEVSYQVTSILDENGVETTLPATFDEDGNLKLPVGSPAGTYTVEYQICQANVPDNCSKAIASIWIGAINLGLEKRVDRQRAVEGEILTFQISVTNNSPFELDDIKLEDFLPDGLLFLSATINPTSNYIWILDRLGIQEKFEVSFDAIAVTNGTFVNEINVTAADYQGSAASPQIIVRARESDLSITKSVTLEEVSDGDEFFYQVIIQNSGIDEGTNVTIFDRLPVGVKFIGWEYESSTSEVIPALSGSEPTLTWTVQHFPVNASLIIRLRVIALAHGTFTNEAWVTSDINDPNPSNNESQVSKKINRLFIPNVIKPDNDGKNDTFVIRADHKFDKTELVIFNRWGDPVYESNDYQNDWDAEGLNSGTYYYQVSGNLPSGEKILYKGWVQVIK